MPISSDTDQSRSPQTRVATAMSSAATKTGVDFNNLVGQARIESGLIVQAIVPFGMRLLPLMETPETKTVDVASVISGRIAPSLPGPETYPQETGET